MRGEPLARIQDDRVDEQAVLIDQPGTAPGRCRITPPPPRNGPML
ncbi:MAG: hypothetical protein ACRDU4_09635 [Mycobacterium sp.]